LDQQPNSSPPLVEELQQKVRTLLAPYDVVKTKAGFNLLPKAASPSSAPASSSSSFDSSLLSPAVGLFPPDLLLPADPRSDLVAALLVASRLKDLNFLSDVLSRRG